MLSLYIEKPKRRYNILSTIAVKAADKVGTYLCKYRGLPIFDTIEVAVDTFHRRFNNGDFIMNRNGEMRILKLLDLIKPKNIFDVGANKGEWSQLVSQLYPSCTIHAFEIVPSTYKELVTNTKQLSNIIPNNVGLSDQNGFITISLRERDTSTATGCKIDGMRFHDEYYNQEITCKVTRALDYLNEKNIESIDFLKVDVEGMDLKVIKGFKDKIRIVRVIQFEYGIFNIASHDLLSDFCRYLNSYGFVVGKIFPRHVDFFEYHFSKENFHSSNYLAVKREEKSLINVLSKRSA